MKTGLPTVTRKAAIVGCGSVFLIYTASSSGWSSADPWFPLAYILSLALAFALGFALRSIDTPWLIYQIWLAVNVAIVGVSWIIPNHFWLPHGLMGNPNYLGCALALGVAGAFIFRDFWALPWLLLGLVLAGSRGAILATGVCLFIVLWQTWRTTAFISFFGSIIVISLLTQSAEFDRSESIMNRVGVWQDTINHMTLFGSGFGSFLTEYQTWPKWTNWSGQMLPHAYNDALELIFELGIGVIPLWIMLVLCLGIRSRLRLVAWTFFALGLTYFPFYVPIVAHIFALTMGRLARTEETANGSLATYPAPLYAGFRY